MRANRGHGPLLQGCAVFSLHVIPANAGTQKMDFQRNIRAHRTAPYRRPSKAHAEEVARHGCRKSPDQYRDVLSGRAAGCVGMCEGSPAPPDPYVGASVLGYFLGVCKK